MIYGFELATKALAFEKDKQTGEIKKKPLIALNKLSTESECNEQDGIRYMLMGFFQGPRNLYQHNHIGSGLNPAIAVVIQASFFLHLLDGHSLMKKAKWIPSHLDEREVLSKMPNVLDRWRWKIICISRTLSERKKGKK